MTDASADTLREALRAIKDPASGRDIVTAGLVEGIDVRGGLVQATLLTDRAHATAMEPVRREVEAVLARQPGVSNATAVLTAHRTAPQAPARGAPPPRPAGPAAGHGHAHGRGGPGGPAPAAASGRRCCWRTSRRSSPSPPARAASASPPSR